MHISFDFDFTLADSSEGTVVCANYALDALGMMRRTRADIVKTIGLSLERTFEVLTGENEPQLAASFKHHFLENAHTEMLDHIHFYEYTPVALEKLKRQGHYLSIVSTKLRERIEDALRRDGYSNLIDDVIGGGCVRNSKPDPEALLQAMRLSCVPDHETIYVGDSVSDGECAKRARVAFIGVLSGTTTRSELEQWNPSVVLEHVGKIGTVESLTNRS